MFSFFQKLAVVFLMCGLPLQGLHASVMPQCKQDDQSSSSHHQQAEHSDAVGHLHDDGASVTDSKTVCDGCNYCQACSAPAIPSIAIALPANATEAPQPVPASHVLLFDPEQSHRPPLVVLS